MSTPFQILITQTEFTFDKAAEPLRVAPAKGVLLLFQEKSLKGTLHMDGFSF